MCICADRHSKRPGQPEVGQFDVTVNVYEQILWLEVAVEDPVSMAVSNTSQQLT